MENEQMEPQMDAAPEDAGRGTDTVMAHMSLGEVVIPRDFLQDPDVMQMLEVLFQQHSATMQEFTVGDPANKINPETGYPEFGFLSKVFKSPIFRIAAPLALSAFLPGIGTALGSSLLGAGAAGSATLGNALIGAGTSALTGGKPLQGAILGGIGANIGNIGSSASPGSGILGAVGKNIPGIYEATEGLSSLTGGIGDALSGAIGSSGKAIQGPLQPGAGSLGTSSGSGILGKLSGGGSNVVPSIASNVSGATGGGSSFSPLSAGANIFGGLNQDAALKKQQKQLLGANQQQQANLESFDPSGITSDPGYQFNLEQGQLGLNKQLAASGALGSGKAIKAAAEYNQNYANNAFKDYYNRWLQKVGGQNALYSEAGNVNAGATSAGANNIAQSLSNAIGAPVGQYGQNSQLELLKRLGLAGA